jgi:antitoxin component YwqK of YwqJK toxin-antitoxin module
MSKVINAFFVIFLICSCKQVTIKRVYYPDGKIKSENSYIKDRLNGKCFSYFENGNIKSERNFKDGNMIGEYKEFYKNGILKLSLFYIKGKQDSLLSEFYDNGSRKSEQNFKNGFAQGESKFYFPNGKINMFAISDADTTTYYIKLDEMGSVIDEYRIAKIKASNDTIKLGSKYSAQISISGPLYKNPHISIRLPSKNISHSKVEGNYEELIVTSGNSYFNFMPKSEGIYYYSGFVQVIDSSKNSKLFPFNSSFVVIK